MPEPLRVAFLGARHPHVFPRLAVCLENPDIEVVGLYEPDDAVSQSIGRQHGVTIVGSREELFRTGALDLVIVEGLDPENPRYVREAVGHARSLLIEKPGAPNLDEMEQMVELVSRSGIHAQLGYMYNYSPVVRELERIVARGVLGPITLARFHAGAPVGGAAELWQSIPEDLGGVLFTDGCHMLALVVRLLGGPGSATGRILKIREGEQVLADIYKQDTLSGLGGEAALRLGAQLHEDAGAAILTYPTMLATFDVTGWEAHNWVEAWSIELFGTEGTLRATLVPPSYQLWMRRGGHGFGAGWHTWSGTGTASGPGASLVADENYRAELDDLLLRLRRSREPDHRALREGLEVVRIADAIYRSASEPARGPISRRCPPRSSPVDEVRH